VGHHCQVWLQIGGTSTPQSVALASPRATIAVGREQLSIITSVTTRRFKAKPSAIEVADARCADISIPILGVSATKSDETRVSVWYSGTAGGLAKAPVTCGSPTPASQDVGPAQTASQMQFGKSVRWRSDQ
jgi:hypothetical protein